MDAGVGGTLHVTTVNQSIVHGPWRNAAFHRDFVEAAKDMMRIAGRDCPILKRLTQMILFDHGECDGIIQGTESEELYQSTWEAEFLNKRGPQSSKCRWYNWMPAQKWYDKQWHEQLR
eukprot:8861869-Lingulodinium_polyedra.AAC.1